MKWFKHDTDARNSIKLRKVRRRYGSDGYAIYWFCLEAIAYEVDKDNLTFDLKEDAETIAFELSIQEKRVEEIMRYMVDLGLFESSTGVITCLKLAERIDKSMTNSPRMRAWLDGEKSSKRHDNVMTCTDGVSTCPELDIELDKEKEKILVDNAKAPSTPFTAILAIYQKTLVPLGMTSCQKLTDARKAKIRTFWSKTKLDLEKFELYCKYIADHCTWMHTDRDNGKGGKWGKKDLFFICKEETYWRVKEDAANDR